MFTIGYYKESLLFFKIEQYLLSLLLSTYFLYMLFMRRVFSCGVKITELIFICFQTPSFVFLMEAVLDFRFLGLVMSETVF